MYQPSKRSYPARRGAHPESSESPLGPAEDLITPRTKRHPYGQRVLGVVRLTDVPAHGTGRRYIIERGLSRMDELRAIVAICERVVDPASEETR
jgi:hypothetical protein